MSKKSCNFVLTKNNPKESLGEFFSILEKDAVYARAQLERGEAGTPHFQACVGYKSQRQLKAVIKRFPGCHVEIAKNALASWRYCGKEDTRLEGPLEAGVPPAARNIKGDLKSRNEMIIKSGARAAVDQGLVDITKFKQLVQSLDLYKIMAREAQPRDVLCDEWHWGVTGAGKTRLNRQKYPDAYIKSNDIWWDGYQGEDVVIIDEIGPQQIGAQHIKNWCDHGPFKAASKGGYMQIRPKKIIFTSNYPIRECWTNENDYLPIERRLTVHHYTKPFGV